MKNTIILSILLVTIGLLTSCLGGDGDSFNVEEQRRKDIAKIEAYLLQNGISAQSDSETGISYVVDNPGTGDAISDGDKLVVRYEYFNIEGGAKLGSDTIGLVVTLQEGIVPAWRVVLPLINEGGEVTIYSPSVESFGQAGDGGNVGPNTSLIFTVEVVAIVDNPIQQIELEGEIIDRYLEANELSAQTDESGVRYQVETAVVEGDSPTEQNSIRVNYIGSLLNNGFVFDQGSFTEPLAGLIEAWRIVLPKMQVGETYIIYSPSFYAYAEVGLGPIPPDAILIFEVELLEVR